MRGSKRIEQQTAEQIFKTRIKNANKKKDRKSLYISYVTEKMSNENQTRQNNIKLVHLLMTFVIKIYIHPKRELVR